MGKTKKNPKNQPPPSGCSQDTGVLDIYALSAKGGGGPSHPSPASLSETLCNLEIVDPTDAADTSTVSSAASEYDDCFPTPDPEAWQLRHHFGPFRIAFRGSIPSRTRRGSCMLRAYTHRMPIALALWCCARIGTVNRPMSVASTTM